MTYDVIRWHQYHVNAFSTIRTFPIFHSPASSSPRFDGTPHTHYPHLVLSVRIQMQRNLCVLTMPKIENRVDIKLFCNEGLIPAQIMDEVYGESLPSNSTVNKIIKSERMNGGHLEVGSSETILIVKTEFLSDRGLKKTREIAEGLRLSKKRFLMPLPTQHWFPRPLWRTSDSMCSDIPQPRRDPTDFCLLSNSKFEP